MAECIECDLNIIGQECLVKCERQDCPHKDTVLTEALKARRGAVGINDMVVDTYLDLTELKRSGSSDAGAFSNVLDLSSVSVLPGSVLWRGHG